MADLPAHTPARAAAMNHRANLILLGQIATKLGQAFGEPGNGGLEDRFTAAVANCLRSRERYTVELAERGEPDE